MLILSLRIKSNVHISSYSMVKIVHPDLELRHAHCVCNIKVQCKEVKNTTSLYL